MSLTNWTNTGTIIQGDITVNLERGRVYSDRVEMLIHAYSYKWDKINVALEYRISSSDEWSTDTSMVSVSADYVDGNKIYGLAASPTGSTNTIVWKYSNNYVLNGSNPEIRVRILPSIKQFSDSSSTRILSKAYGSNKVDLIFANSYYTLIGINNYGQYIVYEGTNLHILDDIGSAPAYTYSGVSSPLHALQIYSDKYV